MFWLCVCTTKLLSASFSLEPGDLAFGLVQLRCLDSGCSGHQTWPLGPMVRAQEWQAGGSGPAYLCDLGQVTPLLGPQSPHLASGDDHNPCYLVGVSIQGNQGLRGAL